VHTLTQDIAFLGFAWRECDHALCIEEAPGKKVIEEFNRALSNGIDLAPVPENSIHYGSLACGHTNAGLRAVAAGLGSSCPLSSEGGVYSLSKIRHRDADFGEAVEKGLRWQVLRWEVRERWPRSLDILQAFRVSSEWSRP